MIAVLGGLADVECDLIRTRTAEGRSWAKHGGSIGADPPKLTPQQQKEARWQRAEGAALKEPAKSDNVGRATISRLGSLSIQLSESQLTHKAQSNGHALTEWG